ncbi:MAG TPA: hypothetical protein VNZ68_11230 [Rhodocyclaceae bacterium]|nr:hypothetical protein [Rhodocyclaceae bacterium]
MRTRSTRARRLRIFLLLWLGYGLLYLPAIVWPEYLNSPMGLLVAAPYLSIYLFNMLGIPGLLQNGGMCGWGWCAPSLFGWCFLAAVWLGASWLLACLIDRLSSRTH